MRPDKEDTFGRTELLYDKEVLGEMNEEHGRATEIKKHVKTPASIAEIRTALRYWFGGKNNHRASDDVWMKCKAVDDGKYVVVGNELKYAEDVNT